MARKRKDWLHLGSGKTYFHRVHQPLQCLVFITPLLLFYQIMSAFHPWSGETRWQLIAFTLMLKFFAIFGIVGNVLPLALVVAILLFQHLSRRDPWDFDPKLYGGMALESVVWGIPFVIIGLAVTRHTMGLGGMPAGDSPVHAAAASAMGLWDQITLSVGAGVYEELLFRLMLITLLNMILVDIFELRLSLAIPIIILASAVLFSAYHHLAEPFSVGVFVFRVALGVYLAGVFIYRGFGIAAGAHAVYDLIVTALQHWR